MQQILQTHMQPIHYHPSKTRLDAAIAPQYILKTLIGDITAVQLFYCGTNLLVEAQSKRYLYNLVIQQFIVQPSCKAATYRFNASQATVVSA